MGNCLSKDQVNDVQDVIVTAAEIAGKHTPTSTSAPKPDPVAKKTYLLSDRPDMDLKAEPLDPKKTVAFLEGASQVADLLVKVIKATEVVLPNPLGDVLEKVTSVLGVLKKMVENRMAWRELLGTIEDHQKTFNEQLTRLKAGNMVPDPESPLLGPVIQYSDALEKLAAQIITEGCLEAKDAPESPLWDKIKTFTTRALRADDEKGSMDGYRKQLDIAMTQFKFALEIFVSFTVDAIKGGVQSLGSDIKAIGEDVKEVRDMMALDGEPKVTTNTPNITEFGGQHKKCLEGTRVKVLEEIRVWAGAKESTLPVYCIADVAGTGKSTIALTMYDKWRKQGPTPLAFFFSQAGAAVRTATEFCFFLKTQIKVLGVGGPELDEYWKKLEPTEIILKSQDIEQQWTKLVYEPLCMLPKSEVRVLVVDALDECTLATRGELLRCILSACSSGSLSHMRIFITTRNEPDIRKLLRDNVYSKLIIQKALRNSENAKTDVAFYVNHRLDESGVFESSPEQRRLLIDRCDGLFIFAFLACQLLEQSFGGDKPLEDILKAFTELDVLYKQTLSIAEAPAEYNHQLLMNILGVIVAALEPLTITAIATLLPTPVKVTNVQTLFGRLGSILGSGGVDEPVYILHATFREFLLRQFWVMTKQVTTKQVKMRNDYAISKSISNRSMARSCLKVLIDELKKDSGERPSVALRYATMTWISHITPELHIQDICDLMRKFFKEKLLNWIEFGAVYKVLPQYMLRLGQLQVAVEAVLQLSTAHITEDDVEWCRAILEFLRLNNTLLLQSDDSVYSSCIIFTPDSNLVHRHYEGLLKDSIPTVILGRPTPTSDSVVLTGHDGSIFGIQHASYSSAGDLLVSAAGNASAAEIMVWDVKTGARLMTYTPKGEFAYCLGVAFLPGNKEIVSVWSGYRDRYVWQLWRLSYETGDLVCPPHPLKGEGDLNCIAWAPDWSYVLCGTGDGKIFRFSVDTGVAIGEIKQAHGDEINTLSFSPDGLKLASTSADNSFKVWDATSATLGEPTFALDYWLAIYGAVFCPTDPSLLAVGTGDALRIYNLTTGTLDSQRPQVNRFCEIVYSPDGKYIATRERFKEHIYLFSRETRDGEVVIEGTILESGHTLHISCMDFLPDNKHIITGAFDQTLRVAKLADVGIRNVITGHLGAVISMALTPDGKQCATVDNLENLCLWDLETGKLTDEVVQCEDGSRLSYPTTYPMTYSSDTQDLVSRSSPNNIIAMTLNTKASQVYPYALGFSAAADSILILALAMAPDDSSLAIMGGVIGDADVIHYFLCIKHMNGPPDAPAVPVDLNITPFLPTLRLGYHPSGDYICYGDYAWGLATELPALVAGDNLATILKETFPFSFECSDDNQPMRTLGSKVLTTLTFGSPVRQTLCLPPELLVSYYSSHDGRIALGSYDGRVMVLDFTHLLTPEETALLSRIREMRKISLQRKAKSRHARSG